MKISHRNVSYNDIPRLVKEGVIKVGTRVKACEDQEKYPNYFTESMPSGEIGIIERVSSDGFTIKCDEIYSNHAFTENFFLDILSDEAEEEEKCGLAGCTCKPSETCPCLLCSLKEGVKKAEQTDDSKGKTLGQIGTSDPLPPSKPISFDEPLTKEAVGRVIETESGYRAEIENISIDGEWVRTQESGWMKRDLLRGEGWHFESSEITIEEAEKLLNKKIKR